MTTDPRELVQQGQLDEALKELQNQVRSKPSDAALRVFLFQLLAIEGNWDRAMTQLNVAAELDPNVLLMAQVCRPALNCEALRAEIFAGKRTPHIFGEPEEWVGWMVQANALAAEGHYGAAQELRQQALEAAPANPGRVDDTPFEWLMDSDSRLGPILEAIIDGRYFWVPYACIHQVVIEEAQDLRDLVWAPANFVWANGGTGIGLIPTRYPGSEKSDDPAIRLARRTEWAEKEGELYLGLGQRVLATDAGDYDLLATRVIAFEIEEATEGEQAPGDEAAGGDAPPEPASEEAGDPPAEDRPDA